MSAALAIRLRRDGYLCTTEGAVEKYNSISIVTLYSIHVSTGAYIKRQIQIQLHKNTNTYIVQSRRVQLSSVQEWRQQLGSQAGPIN